MSAQKIPVPNANRRQILIDPITRLEGHGKIEIFLDDVGQVDRAYLQVPEFRGFEKFVQGRPAEEMPQITSRICGVCPMAHHIASTKALDDLYRVTPPDAAKKIRELVYSIFIIEDHALHLFFLGGPDLIMGVHAPASERNFIGVIHKLGVEVAGKVIAMRRRLRELTASICGKAIHPVFGLPGGVAQPLSEENRKKFASAAADAVAFGVESLDLFDHLVLRSESYLDLVRSDMLTQQTSYMGLVDAQNRLNFYEGSIRVIDETGKESAKFDAHEYLDYVAEHVEPWTYVKFCYLKPAGWHGFHEGADTGIYSVGPLSRLNVAEGVSTPLAQEAYHDLFSRLGGKPIHHTLANHWARLIELLYAAERMKELADDPSITDENVRTLPTSVPEHGVGVVEAPRGTLIHDYRTDDHGLITSANLIVATQNNAARMAIEVDKVAHALVHGTDVPDEILNEIEMSVRAYDPCYGCASHSLPGNMPLVVTVRDLRGIPLRVVRRDSKGKVVHE